MNQELSLNLEDLEIEQMVPVELSEETKGHPENLATTLFNNTVVSSYIVME